MQRFNLYSLGRRTEKGSRFPSLSSESLHDLWIDTSWVIYMPMLRGKLWPGVKETAWLSSCLIQLVGPSEKSVFFSKSCF